MKRGGAAAKALPSSSDSSSSSDSEDEDPTSKNLERADAGKKRKALLDYGALSRHGYRGGLSVLKVPLPSSVNDAKPDWSWSNGKPETDTSAEAFEERQRTRAAANLMAAAAGGVAAPPGDRREKGKSFSQKEKRKRDLGQASRGKNYVEEEKRLLRDSGVYSGFDS